MNLIEISFLLAGGVIATLLLVLLAPAHITLMMDTKAHHAAAQVRLLWGFGPQIMWETAERVKSSRITRLVRGLRDAPRLVQALLIAPKLLPVIRRFLIRLHRLRPEKEEISISLNLMHSTLNLGVAVIEWLGGLPGVTITKRDKIGVDVDASFVLRASPLRVWLIWTLFRNAPPSREFFRRLQGERRGDARLR